MLEEETSVGSGTWVTVQDSLAYSYSYGTLTQGDQINFRLTAKNIYGSSDASSEVLLTASDVPEAPVAPTITLSNTFARITWVAPDDNAESIDYYRVKVQESDLATFTEEATYCDASDGTIAGQLYCEIPMTVLLASPYSLPAGNTIIAQVEAHNAYGYSTTGAANSVGITASTTPDAMNLPTMNNSTTTTSSIVLDWIAQTTAEGGYATVTSYNLYWDSGTSGATWTSLVGEAIVSTATTYTVSTGITSGSDYQFKLKSKNVHGWGDYSSVTTVTASSVPGTPSAAPATSLDSNGDVVVTFTAPDANGEDITSYWIVFDDASEDGYAMDDECDGWENGTILSGLTCTVAMNTLTAAPHSIPLSDLVHVKYQAYNSRGWGPLSNANTSGSTAKTIPA